MTSQVIKQKAEELKQAIDTESANASDKTKAEEAKEAIDEAIESLDETNQESAK